ncbi:MAG TPA: efflux RND transporter periplasmic adaptor subunit, partial [Gemmatimonadales bacterium]|nr:efflux RND transporter periplasmic adaptor subunit [Gemmatimonadales bacterium]
MTRTSTMFRIVLPLAGVGLLGAFVWQARAARGVASSDRDAQPAATQPVTSGTRAEGRVAAYPGAEVTVGTDIAGTVAHVLVQEKEAVRRGQLLVELASAEQRAALAEARARIGEAEANVRLAETQVTRWQALRSQDLAAQQSLDAAVRDRDAAKAQLDLARATADRLDAVLAKTRIVSPIDGVVIARSVEVGQPVQSGTSLVTVADLQRMRIEAEVDEFDAARVSLGATVAVSAEGFDGRTWRGRVEEIP